MRVLFVILPIISLLSACGGSGGGNDNPEVATSVNAGVDQQVIEKSEFTIMAQGSPADGTFTWQRVSGPSIDGLPADGAEQTFTAPDIKANSELVLRVNYQTANGQLVNDELTVFITSNNQLPVAVITQTAPASLPSVYNDVVTLSADASTDPDENGVINSYQWQQLTNLDLNPDSTSNESISFNHPLLENNTTMTWQLTLTDDEGGVASTEQSFTLNKTAQVIIADAGDDQQVVEFDTVSLDANNSEIVTNTKSCFWEQVTGNEVSLDSTQQCITRFIAPDVDSNETISFSVTVTDSKGRTDTDDTSVEIVPKPLGLINDTGMSDCYNNTQKIACASDDFPRQDADVGRDSVSDRLDKSGQGDLAFDFTKLDAFADELPDDASAFSCVRDNVTGLIWEVKDAGTALPPSSSTRAATNHYTWYLSGDNNLQPGSVQGAANSTCPSATDCGLQTYINEVNATDYCNGSNWRVPTYTELMGLLDYARQGQTSLLTTAFFPNQPNANQFSFSGGLALPYWTSQTAADGTSLSQAYIFDVASGDDKAYPKSNTAFVLLVRTPGE